MTKKVGVKESCGEQSSALDGAEKHPDPLD
jgi:hypothetical protein